MRYNYLKHHSLAKYGLEWLDNYGQELVEPTAKELSELNLYLDWDGFMDWSAGIITDKESNKPSLLQKSLNRLFSSQG